MGESIVEARCVEITWELGDRRVVASQLNGGYWSLCYQTYVERFKSLGLSPWRPNDQQMFGFETEAAVRTHALTMVQMTADQACAYAHKVLGIPDRSLTVQPDSSG